MLAWLLSLGCLVKKSCNLRLDYANLKYGFHGAKSSGCDGNGSRTGLQSSDQTLGQRLSVAQQNTSHVGAAEADGILNIHELTHDAKTASPDNDVAIELTSPLREAVRLIKPALSDQQGSVSATTPTHLTELFIRRTLLHTHDLGESNTEYLTTEAYCVIGALEGWSQAGQSCRSFGVGPAH